MLKIKECKALARENLIGRFGTVIGAYFLSLLVTLLLFAATAACAGFAAYHSGSLNTLLNRQIVFSYPLVLAGVLAATALAAFSWIASMWFKIGRRKLLLNICRGREYGAGDIFYAFKSGTHPWRIILAGFILFLINLVIGLIPKLAAMLLAVGAGNNTDRTSAIILVAVNVVVLLVILYLTLRFMFVILILTDRPGTGVGEAFGRSGEMMKGRKLKGFWLLYFSFIFWYLLLSCCQFAALWVLPYIECTTVIFYLDADDSVWQLPGRKGERPVVPAAPAGYTGGPVQTAPAPVVSPAAEDISAADQAYTEPAVPVSEAEPAEDSYTYTAPAGTDIPSYESTQEIPADGSSVTESAVNEAPAAEPPMSEGPAAEDPDNSIPSFD